MANFDLFFGRFQPIHNGHLAVLEKMVNPTVVIVKGKKASEDKKKNPFDFDYQEHLLNKLKPDVRVVFSETGYLPDIIKMLGECPEKVFAGADRITQYKAQVNRANKELDDPLVIRFVETERVTSASVVREALRSGDRKVFKANVPKILWDEYPIMKKRLENV